MNAKLWSTLCGQRAGGDDFHGIRDLLHTVGCGGTCRFRGIGSRRAITWWLCALCVGAGVTCFPAEEAGHHHAHSSRSTQKPAANSSAASSAASQVKMELPPLPAGVTELKFGDFFVRPAGPRGLELTKELSDLDGRRVRILGYMVNQEEAPPGRFLFSPLPGQQVHEHDNGLADDLPASTVFVSVPTLPDKAVPFVPGLMLLTGTLSVGNKAEPDGRISLVRLALDPPSKFGRSAFSQRGFSAPAGKGAERLVARADRKVDSRP